MLRQGKKMWQEFLLDGIFEILASMFYSIPVIMGYRISTNVVEVRIKHVLLSFDSPDPNNC